MRSPGEWIALDGYRSAGSDVYASCTREHAVEWLRDHLPRPEIRTPGLAHRALLISWVTLLPILGVVASAVWIMRALN